MSKKLTIQAVNVAHQAAADSHAKACEAREALRERLKNDHLLAGCLGLLIAMIREAVDGTSPERLNHLGVYGSAFRTQLEPTANSYGYTLVDHPTRRDLVVVQPLEN